MQMTHFRQEQMIVSDTLPALISVICWVHKCTCPWHEIQWECVHTHFARFQVPNLAECGNLCKLIKLWSSRIELCKQFVSVDSTGRNSLQWCNCHLCSVKVIKWVAQLLTILHYSCTYARVCLCHCVFAMLIIDCNRVKVFNAALFVRQICQMSRTAPAVSSKNIAEAPKRGSYGEWCAH